MLVVGADSVFGHSQCASSTNLHEATAQHKQIQPGHEAPDSGEDGQGLCRAGHWGQAACSKVTQPILMFLLSPSASFTDVFHPIALVS